MNIGPFLGEKVEYNNIGLVHGPYYGLSSAGLKNQQKLYFFGKSQDSYLNSLNFVDDRNNGRYSMFLKSTNGGGLDSAKLLSNPNLLELFYEAYTAHIMAHLYDDFNQGNPIIDLLMVQSNLGHDHAQEIVFRVCKRLLNNQSQFFSHHRIKSNWIEVAIDRSEEKIFYSTVDGVNVYFGYLLVFFSILEDLYICPLVTDVIKILKSHLNLNPNHLGWLRAIEQLTIHDIKTGPYYGYALDDIYGCAKLLNSDTLIDKQYYKALNTYHLQDWIETEFNVDYLNIDFVSTSHHNIDMALKYLDSPEKFRQALASKSFFDGVDIFSSLQIYWGRDCLTVNYEQVCYYAYPEGVLAVYHIEKSKGYTVDGFGVLIELLQLMKLKPFEL
jgi:hypothetical protein